MTRPELDVLSRDAFAAFSLHEKNACLQDLADRFAALHDRDRIVLDRDALSRLRRYYSRRLWADLKIGPVPGRGREGASAQPAVEGLPAES